MTPVQLRASNSVLLASTAVQTATGIIASQHLGPAALLAGMAAGLLLRIVAALRFAVAANSKATDATADFMLSLLPRHRCAQAPRKYPPPDADEFSRWFPGLERCAATRGVPARS
jgi:hypothetical protein